MLRATQEEIQMSDAPKPLPGNQGPYSLKGRVAVISGGSSGIGAATAQRLAADGAIVWVGYNTGLERAQAVAASLPGSGHQAVHLPMTDSAAIARAAAAVGAAHGKVDILVNSAAVTRAVPHADLDGLDDALFDQVMITNVRGPFATIRAFRALMKASGDAVIINISSLAGISGTGSSIAYGASKAAMDVMGVSLARVLGPEIRVIGISPSAVNTDFVPGRSRDVVARAAATSPLRRLTEADDVALSVYGAIVTLRQTTGTTILVDSGKHL
jgi:3-oxoacyl-[acyl-carrier protein] reductase